MSFKKLEIPVRVGFCKNCFKLRREGSAYCGMCKDEPERMKVFITNAPFPLKDKVKKEFDLTDKDLQNVIFTYGDTIYTSTGDISYGLIAHEITHVFQQTEIGKEEWWKKYLKDKEFRFKEELQAYKNQHECYKRNGVAEAEIDRIAEDLSGKNYGNVVSFEEAKKLITQ